MLVSSPAMLLLAAPLVSAVRLCKTIPSDRSWPSKLIWATFNETVDGALIKTVPLALPCYEQGFHSDACAEVRKNWHEPDYHERDAGSIMSALFSNRSCDPFVPDEGCTNKNYAEYSVNVTHPNHIVQTLKFAKEKNIRVVVKNTGHDYMGKNTGHGAISIWTHYLRDTKFFKEYKSEAYTGPALKVGAGVVLRDAYKAAADNGVAVVGGDCPSVGFAGGYLLGGGLSPISTHHGLAADNTLEMEVITTDGRFVKASSTENADLFWAMNGGGGGTYGILWSATVKAHDDIPISAAKVQFVARGNITMEKYWEAVEAYRHWTPTITQAKGYSLAVYFKGVFLLNPVMMPNATQEEFSAIFDPLLAKFDELGIPYKSTKFHFTNFFSAYKTLFPEGDMTFHVQNLMGGSRFVDRSYWHDEKKFVPLHKALRSIVDDGILGYEISLNVDNKHADNGASIPQWRTMHSFLALISKWNDTASAAQIMAERGRISNKLLPQIYEVTPNGGAYLNEGDPDDPNWKHNFYDIHYNKLDAIKKKWDPEHLLYGKTAVGSDYWDVEEDGRLCQA